MVVQNGHVDFVGFSQFASVFLPEYVLRSWIRARVLDAESVRWKDPASDPHSPWGTASTSFQSVGGLRLDSHAFPTTVSAATTKGLFKFGGCLYLGFAMHTEALLDVGLNSQQKMSYCSIKWRRRFSERKCDQCPPPQRSGTDGTSLTISLKITLLLFVLCLLWSHVFLIFFSFHLHFGVCLRKNIEIYS
eukprot:EG_transcript_1874